MWENHKINTDLNRENHLNPVCSKQHGDIQYACMSIYMCALLLASCSCFLVWACICNELSRDLFRHTPICPAVLILHTSVSSAYVTFTAQGRFWQTCWTLPITTINNYVMHSFSKKSKRTSCSVSVNLINIQCANFNLEFTSIQTYVPSSYIRRMTVALKLCESGQLLFIVCVV